MTLSNFQAKDKNKNHLLLVNSIFNDMLRRVENMFLLFTYLFVFIIRNDPEGTNKPYRP